MKKLMKRIVLLLLLCAVVMAAALPAAAEESYIRGDADRDGEVTVVDAAVIQRHLASLIGEEYIDLAAADVSGDGIDITDATSIQRYLASMETSYSIGERFNRASGDPVETVEETVAREVMEEVGLRVRNIRYYKSQPWATADDLLVGFYCDVDGDPTIHLDRTELKEGIWVRREDVDSQPDDFSLTNEMMQVFKRGEEPKGHKEPVQRQDPDQ